MKHMKGVFIIISNFTGLQEHVGAMMKHKGYIYYLLLFFVSSCSLHLNVCSSMSSLVSKVCVCVCVCVCVLNADWMDSDDPSFLPPLPLSSSLLLTLSLFLPSPPLPSSLHHLLSPPSPPLSPHHLLSPPFSSSLCSLLLHPLPCPARAWGLIMISAPMHPEDYRGGQRQHQRSSFTFFV